MRYFSRMIKAIRNSAFTKVLWGLMALYFLNISVDSADPFPEHISEDLSINDQESFIELVVEKILGYENAIEENDDNDSGENINKVPKLVFTVHPSIDNISIKAFSGKKKSAYSGYEAYLSSGFYQLDTPPPKF
ncbi:hypothetical protein RM549_13765 [Salegentibacter sp. F188]|uniref:Uncharacterized protein n=1 Tax=Autumnicola patrickiae TaxID=3075591 RepID=A0ABU3E4E2_9FLAO|nr:hypothetical protein [Salegentibacter sp. F188]MDT0690860.1 hypothetical protein [Salegentibacter sp. F188]